jgi:hypothetical protein
LETEKTHSPKNQHSQKWAHELNKEFSKEELQITGEYKKKCPTSLVIKKMQSKQHLDFTSPVRMAIFKGKGNYFLSRSPIAEEIRARIDKWYCIKLKNFCTSKGTIIIVSRQHTEWKKNFTRYSKDKGLIYRI